MAKHSGPGARQLAVLGSPIEHSLSPALHSAAYRTLGLDWTYSRREVKPGDLADFIATLGPEWRGLSLTMPLKHEVLPLVTDLDRVAQLTGAANTVLLSHDGGRPTLSGFNTDVVGIVRALAENGTTSASHVRILGGGATASSALMAAAELGAESVDILVRTPSKAAPLVALGRTLGVVVTVSDLADAASSDTQASELVISTLPGGTELDVSLPENLRRSALLFDVGYSPWPSPLARSWLDVSGAVVSGLPMLLHQALVQVRIFVAGDPFEPLPDEDAVLAAMRDALDEGAATPAK